jgi:hypothetical protein
LLGYIEGDKKKEKEVQNMFQKYHSQLEWFNISEEIMDYINENTLTNTYCEFDDKDILRVYRKIKNF